MKFDFVDSELLLFLGLMDGSTYHSTGNPYLSVLKTASLFQENYFDILFPLDVHM